MFNDAWDAKIWYGFWLGFAIVMFNLFLGLWLILQKGGI